MLNVVLSALLGLVLVVLQPAWADTSSTPPPPTVLPVQVAPGTVLTVTPDRADWMYAAGATATLRIRVAVAPYPAGGVAVRYRVGPEMLDAPEQRAVVPAEGLVLTVYAPALPGFVRCSVQANILGTVHSAMATVGFAPAQLLPTQTEPADFDAFWAAQQAELARVPPDLRLQPAPGLSTPKVEVFLLSFANVGGWAGPSRF